MSLTNLSLDEKNLIIPGLGEFGVSDVQGILAIIWSMLPRAYTVKKDYCFSRPQPDGNNL
jgi:hypothetical protein